MLFLCCSLDSYNTHDPYKHIRKQRGSSQQAPCNNKTTYQNHTLPPSHSPHIIFKIRFQGNGVKPCTIFPLCAGGAALSPQRVKCPLAGTSNSSDDDEQPLLPNLRRSGSMQMITQVQSTRGLLFIFRLENLSYTLQDQFKLGMAVMLFLRLILLYLR